MKNQFDELAKGMAQSVTRRQALKQFGIGLAGMALACFGLANMAEAAKSKNPPPCAGVNAFCGGKDNIVCCPGFVCCGGYVTQKNGRVVFEGICNVGCGG